MKNLNQTSPTLLKRTGKYLVRYICVMVLCWLRELQKYLKLCFTVVLFHSVVVMWWGIVALWLSSVVVTCSSEACCIVVVFWMQFWFSVVWYIPTPVESGARANHGRTRELAQNNIIHPALPEITTSSLTYLSQTRPKLGAARQRLLWFINWLILGTFPQNNFIPTMVVKISETA